ncbi:MAG: NADH-quinone oxidoreductase subunit NuoF [Myxococcota bacterium]|nr:NADH-quinone oxidoreductase subunit NuoF [Myxococcota bacterium]
MKLPDRQALARIDALRQEGLGTLYPDRPKIMVGCSTCGLAAGAEPVLETLATRVRGDGFDAVVARTGCVGHCQEEPLVDVMLPGKPRVTYHAMDPQKAARLADALARGELPARDALYRLHREEIVVDGLPRTYGPPDVLADVPTREEVPFYAKQRRIALRNCGTVDPRSLAEYVARGGYRALIRALSQMRPERVIEEVERSGLRGRGGAGFPTAQKWRFCRQAQGEPKYVICNADEGDPGAFMDRSILEGDPFSVIEGMTIGAYAMGASQGYMYVRSEYPLAVEMVRAALRAAREAGLLGEGILGTDFSFDIRVKEGAGAFVCGEETSLIASLEGRSGEPRPRPPFPAQSGLWGKPTNVNNVKSWAMISPIVARGGAWYATIGAEGNRGTTVFSLVGKVRNTGLVEVPLGITLREMIFDIAGGIAGNRRFKAVQTGGPSGGCLPASQLDLPIDYSHLAEAGSIMGSGGMIVMDEDVCMVDVARYFLHFATEESCGKCTPCREGTLRMSQILERICAGRGEERDLERLDRLARGVKSTALCGLGQTAPNPVLSTLRYFRDEYERHVYDKRCDAHVCRELTGAPCQSACPLGTEAWRYVAHIARGEYEESYRVIREANPFPSVCARVCNHPCESRCRSGTAGKRAIAIRALKRFVADRIDPGVYRPARTEREDADAHRVAIVGSGPAGLTAAHYLSLQGYKVTVYEKHDRPGGMLHYCIPDYRLPADVLRREIDSLLDENITLRCDTELGRDITLDGLQAEGYRAVFLAMGAHKSRRLELPGEDAEGVIPSIEFLKAVNLRGETPARGRVGIVGGGNSAVDAARVAIRQPGVERVTVFYRRTRDEMPAFEEEIEASIEEGVRLETLVAPARLLVEDKRLKAVEFIRNALGPADASGRPRPVPVRGSEFREELDTLIVAVSEGSDTDCIAVAGENRVEVDKSGAVRVDPNTLETNRPGVFAGGDVVRGPNTVVDAIADGKKAAVMIDRYLSGKPLRQPGVPRLPRVYVEPRMLGEEEAEAAERPAAPRLAAAARKRGFDEVETVLSEADAMREARRCLRCDLEFTQRGKRGDEGARARPAVVQCCTAEEGSP